ncbi:MAG: aspartate kinase, partial [Chloroflexi bacterium]|nr:aspartate kinase [Chloroflexota bacterium]
MDKRKILIMKFGGTSVGSADAIRQTAQIVRERYSSAGSIVVVVSAMNGVTNLLLDCAKAASVSDQPHFLADIEHIRKKHLEAIEGLDLPKDVSLNLHSEIETYISQLQNYCQSIAVLGEVTPRGLDAIASLGER